MCSKLTKKAPERLNYVVLVSLLLALKIFYNLFCSVLLLILNKEVPIGKELHLRCYMGPKNTTPIFDRFFGIDQ